jgi:hypothetical protein
MKYRVNYTYFDQSKMRAAEMGGQGAEKRLSNNGGGQIICK